jgi:hypothetical protein
VEMDGRHMVLAACTWVSEGQGRVYSGTAWTHCLCTNRACSPEEVGRQPPYLLDCLCILEVLQEEGLELLTGHCLVRKPGEVGAQEGVKHRRPAH